MYEVETFKKLYPEWFHELDIKDASLGFTIFIILTVVIYLVCIFITNKLKKIKNRNRKEKDEHKLISEYEFIYGQRINWGDEIKGEFDKKWDEIQNKYLN